MLLFLILLFFFLLFYSVSYSVHVSEDYPGTVQHPCPWHMYIYMLPQFAIFKREYLKGCWCLPGASCTNHFPLVKIIFMVSSPLQASFISRVRVRTQVHTQVVAWGAGANRDRSEKVPSFSLACWMKLDLWGAWGGWRRASRALVLEALTRLLALSRLSLQALCLSGSAGAKHSCAAALW